MASNIGNLNLNASDDDEEPYSAIDFFEISSSCVFCVLGSVTILLYLRLLQFHMKFGFKTYFQEIFIVLATNDVFAFLFQLFDVRLPTWGVNEWYSNFQEGFVPMASHYLSTASLIMQSLGTLLIACNRASSLMFPMNYDKIWMMWTRPLCGALIVAPFVICAHIPFVANSFVRVSWGYYVPNTDISSEVNWFYFGIHMACLLCNCPLNIYLGYKLLSIRKGSRISRRELSFHLTTVLLFLIGCINAVDTIICNTQDMDEFYVFFQLAPIFCDANNFAPIWIMLVVSKETRKNLMGREMTSSAPVKQVSTVISRKSKASLISAFE